MVNLERICEDFARITSDNVDPGGQFTINLGRIHKDFARITSDNVDPGGVYTPYNHEISVLPHIPCAARVGN